MLSRIVGFLSPGVRYCTTGIEATGNNATSFYSSDPELLIIRHGTPDTWQYQDLKSNPFKAQQFPRISTHQMMAE
jgi:hypothetical protein